MMIPTRTVSRRAALSGLVGAALTPAVLGGCTSGSGSEAAPDKLTLWHNNGEMRDLFARQTAAYTKSGGLPVELHYEPLTTLGKSIQLAKQSNQMPDIHVLAGLELPPPVLLEDGWLQPMDLGAAADRLPKGALIPGLHIFDDQVYSFPIVSPRQYWAPVWGMADVLGKYDIDPDTPPATWEGFRTACRTVQTRSGGEVWGWLSKLGVGNRMGPELEDMAQAAGWPAVGGVDFRTGEYIWHHEAWIATIEYVFSLHRDKLMHPASLQLSGVQAQARWAAGEAGYWMDGPWLPGYIQREAPQKREQLRVGQLLVPEKGTRPITYGPPRGGHFWLSAQSKVAAEASELLAEQFTTKEFFVGVAESSAVPIDLSAVAEATKVHPAFQQLVKWYESSVFLAPSAVIRNPAVSTVIGRMREVKPGYEDLVQGIFSGDVTDITGAFTSYSQQLEAERERAIKEVAGTGVDVHVDDWAFPDWQPGVDYEIEPG